MKCVVLCCVVKSFSECTGYEFDLVFPRRLTSSNNNSFSCCDRKSLAAIRILSMQTNNKYTAHRTTFRKSHSDDRKLNEKRTGSGKNKNRVDKNVQCNERVTAQITQKWNKARHALFSEPFFFPSFTTMMYLSAFFLFIVNTLRENCSWCCSFRNRTIPF